MDMIFLNKLMRFLIVLSVISFTFTLAYYVFQYAYPFLIAFSIAFLMNPIVNFLHQRLHLPRGLSVFSVILTIAGICVGLLILLVVEIANGTAYLAAEVPEHFKSLINYIQVFISSTIIPLYQRLLSFISTLDPSQQDAIIGNIQELGEKIAHQGAAILQDLLQRIPLLLKELPNYVSVLTFSLLGTFFISKDWHKFSDKLSKSLPAKVVSSFSEVLLGLKQALFGFIKAQVILISITGLTVLIGLLFLKVEHAITIAILTGVVDLMPYLGTGLVFIPWIIYMFVAGNHFLTISLSLLYMLVIIQRQMIEPKILSTTIGLDPLLTLIALFVGFQLFGLSGLIIGPVTLVILYTLNQAGVFLEIWRYITEPK
ncbi:sporulation integral membrane protein YtvI [Thalassobacillus devorans]|uniref:sporulation integral membrane protein YtvI n=1 Tax=Thalassobacillus devorans TaxID=279813 RepID=UPI00048DA316|nr:sporulation integral membrane protein YtvI [Thalassobacillus devorans]